MTNDVIIPRSNETPKFTQEALKLLQNLEADIAKKDAQFMSPGSYIGAGTAAAKVGLGIAGFFNKTPELPRMESTYNIDPNLVNTANAATAKAFDTTDDYAGRIRLRNQRIAQTLSAVGISGGDRNFVAATENAARDTENIGNLQTDLENKKMQQAQLGVAANLQQMALFDRLNKSREEMQAADFNLKAQLAEIAERSKNISGAAGLISSGINDAAGVAGNEMTANSIRDYQKIALFNVLSKLNIQQENNANKMTQEMVDKMDLLANKPIDKFADLKLPNYNEPLG